MISLTHRTFGLLILVLLTLLTISCAEGEKHSLTLQLQEGHSYGFRVEMDQNMKLKALGNPTMNQNIVMNMRCIVEKVDQDGNMYIRYVYDTISFSQNSPSGNISYDSTAEQSYVPDLAKGYAAVVDKYVTMLITPEGLVSDIRGFEDIHNAIIESIEFPDGPEREQFEKQFRDQFGPDSLREMIELSMAYLPKGEVAVGQRWRNDFELTKGFPMRLENTYLLKSVSEETMRIDNESKIYSLPEATVLMGPMELSFEMAGKQTGSMYIDPMTGWVASGEVKQEIAGTMTMDGAGAPKGGVMAPFTMTGAIRYVTFDGM